MEIPTTVQSVHHWCEPDSHLESWAESEPEPQQRDPVVDDAKEELKKFFAENPDKAFYQRQLQIIFEGPFFHWITARALAELAEEGFIACDKLPFGDKGSIAIYRAKSHRYWKRQANEIVELVSRFSTESFTHALGAHGEQMVDAALPTAGFLPKGKNVRSYKGNQWTETGHDLDRIFERDGVGWGTEIKNTLGYIGRYELQVKVQMCRQLGLRPLFIVRMAPKSYINEVAVAGGFTLVLKYQLYPFGQKAFADTVRRTLQLPTDCPDRIADGTVQRFLKGHLKILGKSA